jgi:tetraacyldisaccharide 4'-kinase
MSWGNPRTLKEKLAANLLWPASFGFGVGSYARMMAYNLGHLKQKTVSVPVVSIGNITCGGTGKTPVTVDIARRLIASGKKVGILSRGYNRQSTEKILVVSDGKTILANCRQAGDEPYLIAQAVPDAVMIVGAKRKVTAAIAIADYGCDVILLDDGFQHFALARDCDVVLLDYNDDLENDRLLPAGRLREPLTGLIRAHWGIVTKIPKSPDLERLKHIKKLMKNLAPSMRMSACRFIPDKVIPLAADLPSYEVQQLSGKKVAVFAGIARPESFHADLQAMGADIVWRKDFGDHHWYTAYETGEILAAAKERGADLIVTTEKDAVRLDGNPPVYKVTLKTEWIGPVPYIDNDKITGAQKLPEKTDE